ncbi:Conserved carboxylase region [Alkaliphilus metalliredigens QYMF]|uniref:Conserved carboxylase region n=1 Tax=Alkaliphilus metalliredigens (strain QYMF) TaxID=293826 RepID=A6TT40_ALKMQ|nr:oxaloacetate decarboxylase subunit alpha [Alkaliphilus metalliredigens]ABR49358.1 Conserved carboxylase region [Alkaliphilus metalliredigens QYMF]
MAKVKITETVLRDAHQSLIATRMKIEEMLPVLEKLDQAGYHSLEVWGGATFDSCLRFLNEDPWERLRTIRKHVKNTKLQMLLRGQNLLGYKHYADDVVVAFIKKAVENGIDIVRIFDALNDVRNLETALKATKEAGAHAQIAISYTTSPVHNTKYYIQLAKEMEKMGADSICIKDMAGILKPYDAYELVKGLKAVIKVPIQLHTHYTSGVASMTYIKAIEAGVDVVDCAISPMASGTSQPPTEPLVATLQGTEYDTGMDLGDLDQIAAHFAPLRNEYIKSGLLDPKLLGVDINTLVYQVPGGMLSNLVSQLKLQNAEDKYEEVLKEIPKVRAELGYPPLVTPLSQMVGTQAVFNVIMGERYKIVPKEIKAYVRGEYGRPAVAISEEIQRKIIGNEEVMTKRPADSIPPQLEGFRNEMKEFLEQEEDVLSYALFPQVAQEYFKYRRAQKYKIETICVDMEQKTHPV